MPRRRVSCVLALLIAGALPAQAPQTGNALDSVVRANARPLGTTYNDPGFSWLLDHAKTAQFVALGEEHNAAEIPLFVETLLGGLRREAGFQYLALEQDRVTIRHFAARPRDATFAALLAFAHRYPYGFTFMSDQELDLISRALQEGAGKGRPVWGCDQVFGAMPLLDAAMPLLNGRARELAADLRDSAFLQESSRDVLARHYMARVDKRDQIGKLLHAAAARPKSELGFLLSGLAFSDSIYYDHDHGKRYEANQRREDWMKSCFQEEAEHARVMDGRKPRVVLKFGHPHLVRGINPIGVRTLGNFVSEYAHSLGATSFHVALLPNSGPDRYGDLSRYPDKSLELIARSLSHDTSFVVDLVAVRAAFDRASAGVDPVLVTAMRGWIFGYDAAVFFGPLNRATFLRSPGVVFD